MKINDFKVYDYCINGAQNHTRNSYGLKNECLKSDDMEEIFYLKGNSYVAQFIPIFDNSKTINNFYYIHNSLNTDIEINELNKIAKFYKKIFFCYSNK